MYVLSEFRRLGSGNLNRFIFADCPEAPKAVVGGLEESACRRFSKHSANDRRR